MSLILEALKKSEAERRRGQSPDLFGAALGTAPARREIPRVWPLLLLGLILLASAWLIWSGDSRGEKVPAAAPVAAEEGDAGSDSPPPARVVFVPAPAPPKPSRTATNASTRAAAPVVSAPAVDLPEPPAPIATTPAEPSEDALPTLAILDAGSRASLPPLKLSMHVYAEDAGKRFAIVDGQRITEGALLGPGVVEAIRRDGVVININGRRLLLPKP